MKKYCRKCGNKLEDVECNYYNEETGEKVHTLVCVKVGCESSCDFFGHEYNTRLFRRTICIKCGYIPNFSY